MYCSTYGLHDVESPLGNYYVRTQHGAGIGCVGEVRFPTGRRLFTILLTSLITVPVDSASTTPRLPPHAKFDPELARPSVGDFYHFIFKTPELLPSRTLAIKTQASLGHFAKNAV
mgnify:CR=1 FL=1